MAPQTTSKKQFLTSAQVRERYGGVSDTWIERRKHDGSGFPRPIKVGGKNFWDEAELTAWERECALARIA